MNITELNKDVLKIIFSHLNLYDNISASQTCKTFHKNVNRQKLIVDYFHFLNHSLPSPYIASATLEAVIELKKHFIFSETALLERIDRCIREHRNFFYFTPRLEGYIQVIYTKRPRALKCYGQHLGNFYQKGGKKELETKIYQMVYLMNCIPYRCKEREIVVRTRNISPLIPHRIIDWLKRNFGFYF